MNENQKQWAVRILTLLIVVATGIKVFLAPAPAPAPGVNAETFTTGVHFENGGNQLTFENGSVLSGAANATTTFLGDVSVRNLTVATSVSAGGAYAGGTTPVATATLIRNFSGTAVVADNVSIQGTPVIPYVTPQPTAVNKTYFGATPLAARVICQSIAVTGIMTATPIAPITTPQAVWSGLAQTGTGDGIRTDAEHASGVITVHVWNSALTPVANTTPATVILCEMGQP